MKVCSNLGRYEVDWTVGDCPWAMKGEVPAKTLWLTHASHVSLQESLGGGGVWRGCRVPQQIKTMPMQGHELA